MGFANSKISIISTGAMMKGNSSKNPTFSAEIARGLKKSMQIQLCGLFLGGQFATRSGLSARLTK